MMMAANLTLVKLIFVQRGDHYIAVSQNRCRWREVKHPIGFYDLPGGTARQLELPRAGQKCQRSIIGLFFLRREC